MATEKEEMQRGAIYLGQIPHGFYENEMKGYFSQFGKITRLKLFRSRKTGRSRGYAFIEFKCSEVAKIVADTMNNYLLFEKLLKCHYVDPSTLKPNTFLPNKIRKPRKQKKPRTPSEIRNYIKNVLKKEKSKRKRLKKLGIDYDFPGYKASVEAQGAIKGPKHIVFSEKEPEIDVDEMEGIDESTASTNDK